MRAYEFARGPKPDQRLYVYGELAGDELASPTWTGGFIVRADEAERDPELRAAVDAWRAGDDSAYEAYLELSRRVGELDEERAAVEAQLT